MFVINPTTSTQIMSDVNAYRAQMNLPIMEKYDKSCDIASKRLFEVVEDFSHSGFNASIKAYGSYHIATENLARGFSEPQIVQKWIESPTHNEVLLSNTNKFCVMKATEEDTTYYVLEGVKRDDVNWYRLIYLLIAHFVL